MSLQDHCESASLASTADGSAAVLLLFNNNLARWYWFQYCSFVGVCVGAFVNIITHEPFEISCNLYGSKIWLKARIYSQCLHSDALQRLVVIFFFSYAFHAPWLVSHETADLHLQSVAEISRHSVLVVIEPLWCMSGCVCCQRDSSWTVWDIIIMKFVWQQDTVESLAEFENGCIPLHCCTRMSI